MAGRRGGFMRRVSHGKGQGWPQALCGPRATLGKPGQAMGAPACLLQRDPESSSFQCLPWPCCPSRPSPGLMTPLALSMMGNWATFGPRPSLRSRGCRQQQGCTGHGQNAGVRPGRRVDFVARGRARSCQTRVARRRTNCAEHPGPGSLHHPFFIKRMSMPATS